MKISKKTLIGIALMISVAISSFAALTSMRVAKASPNPIVQPYPPEIVIPFCETGDIAICVENFVGLYGFEFKIWWLKDVVDYAGYDWKPLPPEWPTVITLGPEFDENATHKAVYFAIAPMPPSDPFSYPGLWRFIDLYWHCIRPGVDSPLIFDRDLTNLYDEMGLPIPIERIIDGLVINPPGPPEDLELYPREVVDLGDPTCTQWHELHPDKSRYYHLTGWEPSRVLTPCDQIDMYALDSPEKIYLESMDLVDLMLPICTEWFEVAPMPFMWHLSSWEDTNGDGMLSPSDQIDMTNLDTGDVVWFHVQDIFPPDPAPQPRQMILDVKYWFEVDEVTVDMWLSPLEGGRQIFVEYKCGYWTFDPENPICTKWNEIEPDIGPVRCLHLTSWIDDNEDGELSPCDTIDMTPMFPWPGPVEYYHVDFMSISLKLTPKPSPPVVPPPPVGPVYLESAISYDEFDLANPVCTKWHEIYPFYSRIWHLSSWENSLILSPSDQIVLTLKDPVTHEPIPGTEAEYHVDKLTVAMNLTSMYTGMEHIVKFEGSLKQFKNYHWMEPISTQWHEVNPTYCRQWHLWDWMDTGPPPGLSPCDYILMIDKETGEPEEFHVESLSTDIIVTLKVHDVAVINVTHLKTVVGQGLCMFIDATVENQGYFTETNVLVTAFADSTAIQTQTIASLAPGAQTTLTFLWNTTGFAKGVYTLSTHAWKVPGEIDTADNTYVDCTVTVACIGDITGPFGVPDGVVDMRDISLVARGFGASHVTNPASPKYCQYWHPTPCAMCPHSPNCDLTGPPPGLPDGTIDMRDISLVARLFGTGGC